jgi:hypothetical protein
MYYMCQFTVYCAKHVQMSDQYKASGWREAHQIYGDRSNIRTGSVRIGNVSSPLVM